MNGNVLWNSTNCEYTAIWFDAKHCIHICRSPPPTKMHTSPPWHNDLQEKLERKIRLKRCASSKKNDANAPLDAEYITQIRACGIITLLRMEPTHHCLSAPMNPNRKIDAPKSFVGVIASNCNCRIAGHRCKDTLQIPINNYPNVISVAKTYIEWEIGRVWFGYLAFQRRRRVEQQQK